MFALQSPLFINKILQRLQYEETWERRNGELRTTETRFLFFFLLASSSTPMLLLILFYNKQSMKILLSCASTIGMLRKKKCIEVCYFFLKKKMSIDEVCTMFLNPSNVIVCETFYHFSHISEKLISYLVS